MSARQAMLSLIKGKQTTTYTASVTLEAESTESMQDARIRLAMKCEGVASSIKEDVDRARSVMAP